MHFILSWIPVFFRATLVMLIHNWIPTYASLCWQGREHSPFCPWCHTGIETVEHVIQCNNHMATEHQWSLMQGFLQTMLNAGTPIHMIVCWEYKLSLVLNLPWICTYQIASQLIKDHQLLLIKAVQNQNIIWWDLLLHGFCSTLWLQFYNLFPNNFPNCRWDVLLVSSITTLLKGIWDNRNKIIHGATRMEASKQIRERMQQWTRAIYLHPQESIKVIKRSRPYL